METKERGIKALALLSGGLDSQLAVCVLKDQGVEVEGVTFESPFFGSDVARAAAAQLGIRVHVIDFTEDIVGIIRDPPHGFGSQMNPCIDCHARMFRRAANRLEAEGARFLCTGEVLDERPMSQTRRSLRTVAKASGFPDLIVRPLSARLLDETLPERMGWIDRRRLLALRGRSRRDQFELAKRYGLTEYPTPSGGCRLTEPNFSRRLRDLVLHEGLDDVRAIRRLRIGRHLRLASGGKVIIGRDHADNEALVADSQPGEFLVRVEDIPGPTVLAPAGAGEAILELAARLCVRYGDARHRDAVDVSVRKVGGETRMRRCSAVEPESIGAARL